MGRAKRIREKTSGGVTKLEKRKEKKERKGLAW